MRTVAAAVALLLLGTPVFSQRPSDPALLVPQEAPALEYAAVANPLTFPEGTTIGAAASVAFDASGHLWVLNRGPQPLAEFDGDGRFLRAFGEGLFTRSHGLHIDSEGHLWATDVGGHTVMKIDRQGRVLLTLGTKGQAGTWSPGSSTGLLSEPTDVTIAPNGEIYVVQGHTPGPKGDPRVLRFDRTGRLIASWGGKGKGPGQFDVAHGVAIDAKGLVWVADRENQRVQFFTADGTFVREMKYAGLPCGFAIGAQYVYMVNGFAGQLVRLDLDGRVLAVVGKAGQGVGEFGEAHFVAVSPRGEIFVADSVNRAVQKFVRK